MIVYRIVKDKHSDTLIPPSTNNRWNSKKHQLLYTSWTRSLACLENIVHKSGEMLSQSFTCMHIEIPDSVKMSEIKLKELPTNWRAIESSHAKIIGDYWAASLESCVLKVPSAIIEEEYNYLINVLHPDFSKIKLKGKTKFVFDSRIKS